MRRDDVNQRKYRKEKANANELQRLIEDIATSKSGHTLVPDTGEQLLYIRMGAELKMKRRLCKHLMRERMQIKSLPSSGER